MREKAKDRPPGHPQGSTALEPSVFPKVRASSIWEKNPRKSSLDADGEANAGGGKDAYRDAGTDGTVDTSGDDADLYTDMGTD